MKLYINQENIITSGDPQPDTVRELTDEEIQLYISRRKYKIEEFYLVDISQTPEYLAEKLSEAKCQKLTENQQKRDEKLIAGVIYQNVLFDSDDAQLINIIGNTQLMSDEDTINWRGFDGVTKLVCTKIDLYNIGNLIRDLRSNIWDSKNPQIIELINAAQTIDELEQIIIDYSEV